MFHNIVVPLSGDSMSEAALWPAASIARAHGATLHLVVVGRQLSVTHRLPDAAEYFRGEMQLLARELRAAFGVTVTTRALDPVDRATGLVGGLVTYGNSVSCDLFVMMTHGRVGLSRAWLGSVADDLVHAVKIPVLLLRGEAARPGAARFERVLVAVDDTSAGTVALCTAYRLVAGAKADVTLLQVVPPVPAQGFADVPGLVMPDMEVTDKLVAQARQALASLAEANPPAAGITVHTRVEVAASIQSFAAIATAVARVAGEIKPDLVALTTHDRGVSRVLVGSVVDHVLRHCATALLVCHGGVSVLGSVARAPSTPAAAAPPVPTAA